MRLMRASFTALMLSISCAEPSLAVNQLRVADIERLPLGSKLSLDALIFLGGGGYWFVLRSARCGAAGVVRVLSGVGPRIRAEVYKAVSQTNDHRLIAARADIYATKTMGSGPDIGRLGFSITSFRNLRLVRCDCVRSDPAFR